MKHSTGKPTKADQLRFSLLRAMGCICCILKGYDPEQCVLEPYVEIHHLLSGNRRRGHQLTIPLCQWHHRGIARERRGSKQAAREWVGPSLADGSKPFHEAFGSDDELLAMVNERLESCYERA